MEQLHLFAALTRLALVFGLPSSQTIQSTVGHCMTPPTLVSTTISCMLSSSMLTVLRKLTSIPDSLDTDHEALPRQILRSSISSCLWIPRHTRVYVGYEICFLHLLPVSSCSKMSARHPHRQMAGTLRTNTLQDQIMSRYLQRSKLHYQHFLQCIPLGNLQNIHLFLDATRHFIVVSSLYRLVSENRRIEGLKV